VHHVRQLTSSSRGHGQTWSLQVPPPPNRRNTLGISVEPHPNPPRTLHPPWCTPASCQHRLPLSPPHPTTPLLQLRRTRIRKGRVKAHVHATLKTFNQVIRLVCTRLVLRRVRGRLLCGLCRCQPDWGRTRLAHGYFCEGVGVCDIQLATTRAREGRNGQGTYAIPSRWSRGIVRDDPGGIRGSQDSFFARTSGTDRSPHSETGQLAEVAWVGRRPRDQEGCGGIEASDSKRSRLEDCESELLALLFPYPEGFNCTDFIAVLQLHRLRYGIQHINISPLFYEGGASSAAKDLSQLLVLVVIFLLPTLQNPLLDKVVWGRTVLESVVDLVLQHPSIYSSTPKRPSRTSS